MVRQGPDRLTGNEAFEGFAIDLIAEIAQILSGSFEYYNRVKVIYFYRI